MSLIAELKNECRQALHAAMASYALFSDATTVTPQMVTVRWHNRIQRFTEGDTPENAEVIFNIDRLIFNKTELANAEPRIGLTRGAIISFPEYNGIEFRLDTREPTDGPVTEVWLVTRE